jgi:transposase
LVSEERVNQGRFSTTTFLIVNAQSVKNADTAESKGYDAGKKVSGIKRTIAVDTQGLPNAITVTTANVTTGRLLLRALPGIRMIWRKWKRFWADGGYTGKPFAGSVQKTISTKVEVAKRNELHVFAVTPKRWVVERSFAWIEQCRRLWKNCERKLSSSLHMVILAIYQTAFGEIMDRF